MTDPYRNSTYEMRISRLENDSKETYVLMGQVQIDLAGLRTDVTRIGDKVERIDHRVNDMQGQINASFDRVETRFVEARTYVDGRFDVVDARLDGLQNQMDERFDAVDTRFDSMQNQMDSRFAEVDARFDEVNTNLGSINQTLAVILTRLPHQRTPENATPE